MRVDSVKIGEDSRFGTRPFVTAKEVRASVKILPLLSKRVEVEGVQINEPHMYAEDDAVAKIDGYVIAVAGAGPFIGEKRLVRIESVGRTAASGVLADAPVNGDGAAPAAAGAGAGSGAGPASDDDDQRKTRRRGRRGGRGRSKAGTAAEAAEG